MKKNSFISILTIAVSVILAAAFFLPYTGCTNCYTPEQMAERKIPESSWTNYKKSTTEKLGADNKLYYTDCYEITEYNYAYDNIVDLYKDGIFSFEIFLFLCFFWQIPALIFKSKFHKLWAQRFILLIFPLAAGGACYFIFYTSFLSAEYGAEIAFVANLFLMIAGLIDIVLNRSIFKKQILP
ncbi:MAG: hypothetical protein CVV49_18590 [Spirochaetae bacterium HGW-Spirochaetae-5]|nr:MAG: hypothetical protein CVV49_18590 [Spirochaetae bacterium HGW-Spirochaetae-5]